MIHNKKQFSTKEFKNRTKVINVRCMLAGVKASPSSLVLGTRKLRQAILTRRVYGGSGQHLNTPRSTLQYIPERLLSTSTYLQSC